MIDIFDFNDYRAYIRAWLDEENARRAAAGRARLTHRRLAELMGATSSASLANVLSEGRTLTDALAQKVRLLMGHDEDEHAWLLLLLRRERAQAALDRARAALLEVEQALQALEEVAGPSTLRARSQARRRQEVRQAALRDAERARDLAEQALSSARARQEVRLMDRRRLQLVSDWLTLALLELARCEGFRADPDWLSSAFRGAATAEQVATTLRSLADLGHALEPGGPLPGVLKTPPLVEAQAVRGFYLSLIERVAAALREHVAPTASDFQARSRLGAVTVAVPTDGLPVLHEAMARAQDELLALAEALPGRRDLVVQVYLHLFPLSERIRPEGLDGGSRAP